MKKEIYAKMPGITMTERSWPQQRLTKSPSWCAVDLRD